MLRAALTAMLTLVAALGYAAAAEVPHETVEADVSTRSVSITSNFAGTEILVFGTVENSRQPSPEAGTYDVVVVVEGAASPLTVRKKDRVGGVWINSKEVRFAAVPVYYAIASTRSSATGCM